MAENKIGYKYNGTIEQFKASDYPTTHADRIVYITGDDYGIGRGVFCGGNYYDAYNPYKVAILPTIATAPTSGYQYSVTACTIDGTASEVYNALVACANAQVPVMIHYTGSNAWRWFMGSCTIPASGQVLLEYWLPSGSHFQIVFTSSGFRNGNCWNIRQGLQNVMDSGSSSGSASKEVVKLGSSDTSITAEPGKVYRWNNYFLPDDGTELEIAFDLPTDTTQHAEYFFEIPVINSGEGTAVTIVSPDSLRIADNTCKAGYVTFIRVVYANISSIDRWYVADKTEVYEQSLWL